MPARGVDVPGWPYLDKATSPSARELVGSRKRYVRIIATRNNNARERKRRQRHWGKAGWAFRVGRRLDIGWCDEQGATDGARMRRRPVRYQCAGRAMSRKQRRRPGFLDGGLEVRDPIADMRGIPVALFDAPEPGTALHPKSLPVLRPRVI